MAKGKNLIGKSNKKKIVTKEVGQNVSTTFSTESANNPQVNTVQTPPLGSTQGKIMYWPSPQVFYQQGKDLAKKAYNEYLNATNQYLNVPPDQFDQKMQQAGQMNNLAESMVQGIAIGTEAAENISKRIRTGDQAALIEMEAVKETLTRLLKTTWIHNKAAASGKFAGLEAKLLDSSLITRLNQATQVQATNYGIPVESPEEADTIWVDQEMPAPGFESVAPDEQVTDQSVPPEMDEAAGDQSEVPPEEETDEFPPPDEESSAEGIPPSESDEVPIDLEEEAPVEEETPEGEEEIPIEEAPVEEEFPEEEEPVEEEPVEEELPEGEEPIEEEIPEGEEPIEEEIPEGESEELDEDGLPLPSGPDGYYTKEDMLKYGEMVIDQVMDQEGEPDEEEPLDDQEEEVIEEETPEGDEEEVVAEEEEPVTDDEGTYCIMCDKYVTQEDIDACEEENCPFKAEMADEEEDTDEEEVPVDLEEESDSEEEEVPIEVDEEEETDEEEKGISNGIVEKHFIMNGTDDHSDHNVKTITIKEFTGLEGEYCLDCQKIVSYSFDQSCWSSEDAKNWVNKQNKINKQKNISSEEIIQKSLDNIPEEVLEQWIDERTSQEVVVKGKDEVDIDLEEFKEVLSGDVFKNILEKAFEPIMARVKNLEA